jgi:hypothetical protein
MDFELSPVNQLDQLDQVQIVWELQHQRNMNIGVHIRVHILLNNKIYRVRGSYYWEWLSNFRFISIGAPKDTKGSPRDLQMN